MHLRFSVFVMALMVAASMLTAPPVLREAQALQAHEMLDDPVLEARAREISAQLRCYVCQNQSIDDSNAELARDLRTIVRERLVEGETNKQVIDYLVSRYGDFILLNPPVKIQTIALWVAPALFLLFGIGLVARLFMRRTSVAAVGPAPLSAAEQKALDDLIKRQD